MRIGTRKLQFDWAHSSKSDQRTDKSIILDLFSNLLTSVIPRERSVMTSLKHLDLQENSSSGAIPSEIENGRSEDTQSQEELLDGDAARRI